jgi:hypothetical protein
LMILGLFFDDWGMHLGWFWDVLECFLNDIHSSKTKCYRQSQISSVSRVQKLISGVPISET